MVCLVASACFGGNDERLPATPTAGLPTATAALSPTPDAIGSGEADGARIFETNSALAVDIGPRPAGSEGDAQARTYLQRRLEEFGYIVTQQAFPFAASRFLPGRVDAGGQAFGGYSMRGSAFGDAAGPIVFVGLGRPEDFPVGGLNGAIALIERRELTLGDKARNAAVAGASAVLIFNDVPGNFIGDLGGDVPLAVLGLRQTDGIALRDMGMPATITLPPPSGTSYNVLARPAGAERCDTLTGGHFDTVAVTGGAHDNGSGTAGVIEMARLVAANRPAGVHCFALFGAEELGLIGSEYYVAQMSPDDRAAMRVMLNLDMIGGDADLFLIGSEDMLEVARIAADRLGVAASTGELVGASSDHASFAAGDVPVVMFNRNDSLIHTQQDTIDHMRPGQLEDTVRVAYATLVTASGP